MRLHVGEIVSPAVEHFNFCPGQSRCGWGWGVGGGYLLISCAVPHLGKSVPPLGCLRLTAHAGRDVPETHVGALRLKHSAANPAGQSVAFAFCIN